MPTERRLCLTRIRWEHGKPGVAIADGGGYSAKLSISIRLDWGMSFIGFWSPSFMGWASDKVWWICLIPCLPIRVKLSKSYGGIVP